MKRIIVATLLCFASTAFADKTSPAPPSDPSDATNPAKKGPEKGKEPRVPDKAKKEPKI